MAGRNREFDEDKALAAATEVFWTKGYESASMEDLLQAMDLNKGSMYNAFGSKRELFIQVIDHFFRKEGVLIRALFEQHKNPIKAFKEIFRQVTQPADMKAHTKGCFLVNTLGEMSGMDEELAALARHKLLDVETIYLHYIKKGVKEGYITNEASPETLAKYLVNMWNGMSISRRMYGRKELEKLVELQLGVLQPA
ncbi:TetR/AcrR family transcriptional regulator [Chitinophaga barathri]|uniref:TetR/AcrR family transcriptional regulator n=1 Tax=Chitinophaga barathri TaxID=1647451 RepID=A0A3N4MBD6_9BACT|nr:TetR/AcrR family transcriptional regulator [Chitinophaga barathri]RPD41144.1 TetR/AcrR family transcriptional regulator [Chitinophaga barathri]